MSYAIRTGRKRARSDSLAGARWTGHAATAVRPSSYFRWKGWGDRAAAAILLIPAMPVIGLLFLLVRLTSAGPGIYRQKRVGKHGRTFIMYKLRTMRCDAEAATGAVWSTGNDPRATRLGRLLRYLHLDELPQLFNVLKGEMSLVGPRPERPEFVHILAEQIPGYLDRLAVPPGVTGLAQLNLSPDTDLESVRQKLVLDIEYIESGGFLLDARIVLCTALRILKLPVIGSFGLGRQVPFVHVEGNSPSGGNGSSRAREPRGQSLHDTAANGSVSETARSGNGKKDSHEATNEPGNKPKPR
jgi:lipopolysaccharide/colanic/teichoic acid biosynthesis glycosyltransferase